MTEQVKTENTIALVIVIAGVGFAGFAMVGLIANSLDEFTSSIPRYKQSLVALYGSLITFLEGFGYAIQIEGLLEHLSPNSFIRFLNYMLSGLSNILGDGLVVFFAVLFILTSGYQTGTVHLFNYRGEHVSEIPLRNLPDSFAKFVPERRIVVDCPVEYDAKAEFRIDHRLLRCRRQVHDAQSPVAEDPGSA